MTLNVSDCGDPGGNGDNCQGIGWEGMCTDDGTLVWCEDGELVGVNCADQDQVCWTVPGINYSDCF